MGKGQREKDTRSKRRKSDREEHRSVGRRRSGGGEAEAGAARAGKTEHSASGTAALGLSQDGELSPLVEDDPACTCLSSPEAPEQELLSLSATVAEDKASLIVRTVVCTHSAAIVGAPRYHTEVLAWTPGSPVGTPRRTVALVNFVVKGDEMLRKVLATLESLRSQVALTQVTVQRLYRGPPLPQLAVQPSPDSSTAEFVVKSMESGGDNVTTLSDSPEEHVGASETQHGEDSALRPAAPEDLPEKVRTVEDEIHKEARAVRMSIEYVKDEEAGYRSISDRAHLEWRGVLGAGKYGIVYLARHTDTQRDFAVKCLPQRVVQEHATLVERERETSLGAIHPFIARMFTAFEDEYYAYMILEFCACGEFLSLLRKVETLPVDLATIYFAELVAAVGFLHSMDVVHRDLKPENILLRASGHIALTDFGFARKLTGDYEAGRANTMLGTPEYLAPEIIKGGRYDKEVDWWGCGIILFEMLAGFTPFVDNNDFAIYERALKEEVEFPPAFDADAQHLVARLLAKNPSERIGSVTFELSDAAPDNDALVGADRIFDHAFLQSVDRQKLLSLSIPLPLSPTWLTLFEPDASDTAGPPFDEGQMPEKASDPTGGLGNSPWRWGTSGASSSSYSSQSSFSYGY